MEIKTEIVKRQEWLAVISSIFNLNRELHSKYVVRDITFNKFLSSGQELGGYLRLAFHIGVIKISFKECLILEDQIWQPFKHSDTYNLETAYFDALQIESFAKKEDTLTLYFYKFPYAKHTITLEECSEIALMEEKST